MGDRAPKLNKELFLKRLEKLYTSWKDDAKILKDVSSIFVLVGSDEDAAQYSKSVSFQTWLTGFELKDTLILLTKKGVHILGNNRKADFFLSVVSESPRGSVPPVKVHHRDKSNKDAKNFENFLEYIKSDSNTIGVFAKDKAESEFSNLWEKALKSAEMKKVDVSLPFSHLFSMKDEEEMEVVKKSATATVNIWSYARKRYVEIIDQERKVRHSALSEELDKQVKEPKVQGPLAKGKIEACYAPIVMSGGTYSFKWSNESTESYLHSGYGSIVTSLGARYEEYCTHVTRTMLISPSKELEDAYEAILYAETAVINALKEGTRLCDVYNVGTKALAEKNPKLLENLHKKELGFVTGIEFRDSCLTISPKCEEKVQAGMIFVVFIGVENIRNKNSSGEDGKRAAIALSDTVLVKAEGENEILTEKAKSRLKSNVVRFKEDAPGVEKGAEKENGNNEFLGRGQRSVVLTDQTRNKTTNEEKRKERQRELAEKVNEAAKARLAQKTGGSDDKKVKKSNISYKSYEKFPQDQELEKLLIHVDRRHDTILLPIFGVPVPFHISMIKNCSQSVEGDFTYLRINFNHPGSQIGKDNAQFPFPMATYLKELSYRASNMKEHGEMNAPSFNLNTAIRLIKEIQKRFKTEEAEEREKEGAVKQDKLVLSQSKVNPKIKDLLIRPNIIQKRITGSLEAHVNGFRYTSLRGDRIDVIYNNIKHAFFQPCDNEMIILLHFHLKNPVMWGKKKYKDVQFYTEVGEITTDLGKYHHMQDRDDVHSEQVEREMRRKLNAAFASFTDKVRRLTNDQVDFDSPFTDLGFFGVPYRSSCTLRPTSLCLVNLTEWPPFIVTLSEVELVHFERVSFQLKNFDMVFVFKDYARKTQMVQQIPMNSLDTIKEWLNSCDIRYTEGIQSLNWPKIMKTIVDDPEDFFETGGWKFLDTHSDDEGAEDESESEDSYDPSDSEGSEEDSDEDESEGEQTESEDEEGSLDSDESEGKEWSDLEEEAARADKRMEQEGSDPRHRDRDRDRKRGGVSSKGGLCEISSRITDGKFGINDLTHALKMSSSPETSAGRRSATPTLDPSDGDDLLMCRVCRGNEGSLYYPCLCTGSIKYVHQECLIQWLKYSKKEVCELCSYKYSFQPIYRPDMPKALPLAEITKGVLISTGKMFKTWLLYTLVMVAWLGLVPLTTARIYNCIFHVSLHELFSLPFQVFRTDQIFPDIIKGGVLLAIFICIFISLVWLREQIVLGGPANFLAFEDEVEGDAGEVEEAVGAEEAPANDAALEEDVDTEDDNDEEEEGAEIVEEAAQQANVADAGVEEAPRVRRGRQPRAAAQDQDDNWRDWDRFGEDMTWQRLLGLDGSLVFLEHVFWMISLNTLFTVTFAYLPYRFGSYVLHLAGVQGKLQYFPSITAILCGYVVIAMIFYVMHQFVGFLKIKPLYRIFGIAFLILKVFLLVLMEIGFFPVMCGCWMDICTLPLFSATLSQRVATFAASPFMSVFIHWMIGMVYVFYSASFVLLLREVLRPGVLWFMRNLNDPDFNPIQEMIDQPFSRHFRRIIISTSLFFTTILMIFYVPLKLIQKVLPSVLPYNVSMSADTPLSELSLELLILQVVLPTILEQAHGRTFLKIAVRQWCRLVGRVLKLDRYLLSDNAANERQAQPAAAAGGGLAAEHQALLLLREPQAYEPYVRPSYFPLRIAVLLAFMAATTSYCSVCFFVVPATIGRLTIHLVTGHTNVHEIYSVGLGLYICWLSGKAAYVLSLVFRRRDSQNFRQAIRYYSYLGLRLSLAALPVLFLIPWLIGVYFQLVVLTPMRLSSKQTPLYFPYQDWAMGILQMKVYGVAVLIGPDWWLKRQLETIHQQGLANFNATDVLLRLALPISLYLGGCIAVPAVLVKTMALFHSWSEQEMMLLLRFSYPLLLFVMILVAFIQWQLVKFRELAENIKNEKYLVGTQLVNYER
ncbi:unnamed protein product [Caenorhabditis auriculariae]|uniref:FACT complex subunit n=1 Tax=Caenorhabditis auriculariae TaxID=2777116 RepID=A0A8S1GMW2_9PELO|nr:unnamed protein product [Caenorhabditis auriculariae]